MKKMVFCIVPLIMVLMGGCASSGTVVAETNSNADGTRAMAKLVADINTAKPGSTVTLSGRAWLNTVLTVPEGVMLDLTAEGAALELQDGSILTVDGTVNATGHGDHGQGWVEGSLRFYDGATVIAGKGTIYLKSKGNLFNLGGDNGRRTLTLDGVSLVGLPDNDRSLVGVYENSEFILKSGEITANTRLSDDWANGGGVDVWRGTFTMEGGTISGNSAVGTRGSGGGGVQIGEESVFTMIGGTITGNTAREGGGGGVNVSEGSSFTMQGGTISGNSARHGGGVNIDEESVFTMTSGEITGNSTTDTGSVSCVAVWNGSTFTMKGGKIAGNNARGVFANNSTFIMEDGEISGNKRNGVAIHTSIFTMSGGMIYGNTSPSDGGGGVSVLNDSSFTMTGGVIFGNSVLSTRGGGGGVNLYGATFTMSGGRIQGNKDSDGFAANTAAGSDKTAFQLGQTTAKWGTGGTYTKGGVSQKGGSDIGSTNDTLIAVPAK